ncbi:hypothetical protein A2480_02125 [Candidatus Uhrbacteria bacterium RIFOXYC2_FULL_47_19]|uniref:Uncharacterized protein n=1 Tax=Candidatus Uhrbacteria bacterium RIFOXYC2_FULL_47_19 TaxID=1802424 RepID=A0A1F7WH12_9BACT|nr:MAG: hypothetical protein A2480_02125 [Candidatus Uhrbacteria bacterium RIFOXYC2_FULL_47_19]
MNHVVPLINLDLVLFLGYSALLPELIRAHNRRVGVMADIIVRVIRRLEEENIFPRSSTRSDIVPPWANDGLWMIGTNEVTTSSLHDPDGLESASEGE